MLRAIITPSKSNEASPERKPVGQRFPHRIFASIQPQLPLPIGFVSLEDMEEEKEQIA
jgi:hypothetical protein